MTDVFVNLQSSAYKALPFVFDIVLRVAGNIVVVVSPLVNLMKDQIDVVQDYISCVLKAV